MLFVRKISPEIRRHALSSSCCTPQLCRAGHVRAWWCTVHIPVGGDTEQQGGPRVLQRIIASTICFQPSADHSWKILIDCDRLDQRDHAAPGGLEQLLVVPSRIRLRQLCCQPAIHFKQVMNYQLHLQYTWRDPAAPAVLHEYVVRATRCPRCTTHGVGLIK